MTTVEETAAEIQRLFLRAAPEGYSCSDETAEQAALAAHRGHLYLAARVLSLGTGLVGWVAEAIILNALDQPEAPPR